MIPIFDSPRSRSVPYVNLTIIALNFIVFFYELYLNAQAPAELERFIREWGTVPACTFDAVGWDRGIIAENTVCRLQPNSALTPITSMFMHLGWLHILGNMLFLFVFGDNVEDAVGHVLYAAFYLLVGIIATLAHSLTDIDSLVPAVGASGAVAGIMGAYIVLYPKSVVTAVIPPLFFLPLPVPAIVLIGIWFVIELVSGFASLGFGVANVGSDIAYFAHIGGFVAGAVLIKLFAVRGTKRTSRRYADPYKDVW
jgi:membrane associated rhomboid family serine protease